MDWGELQQRIKERKMGERWSLLIAGLYKGEESRCDRQSVFKEFKQQINTLRLSSHRGGEGGVCVFDMCLRNTVIHMQVFCCTHTAAADLKSQKSLFLKSTRKLYVISTHYYKV